MNDLLLDAARRPLLVPSPPAKYRPPVRRVERDGLSFLVPESHGAGGPAIVAPGRPPPAERVFALAAAVFGGLTTGATLTLEIPGGEQLAQAALARGWTLDEDEPALVLAPIPEAPLPPPELVIACVADEPALRRFFDTVRFGSLTADDPRERSDRRAAGAIDAEPPPSILEHLIPSLKAATDRDTVLFVGSVDGRPVATAIMYRLGDVAEIVAVTTLPQQRRRGYGTAMTWAALREAAGRGCVAATLTATPMGGPVYVRMGFVPVCRFRTYAAPE